MCKVGINEGRFYLNDVPVSAITKWEDSLSRHLLYNVKGDWFAILPDISNHSSIQFALRNSDEWIYGEPKISKLGSNGYTVVLDSRPILAITHVPFFDRTYHNDLPCLTGMDYHRQYSYIMQCVANANSYYTNNPNTLITGHTGMMALVEKTLDIKIHSETNGLIRIN